MEPHRGPIHSRFEDDPAYGETIDAFVLALAERVDQLQDTELGGDFPRLLEQVSALGAEAEKVGYEPLRRVSEEVAGAARQRNPELARKALIELTDVARRVRQGHRGSL